MGYEEPTVVVSGYPAGGATKPLKLYHTRYLLSRLNIEYSGIIGLYRIRHRRTYRKPLLLG